LFSAHTIATTSNRKDDIQRLENILQLLSFQQFNFLFPRRFAHYIIAFSSHSSIELITELFRSMSLIARLGIESTLIDARTSIDCDEDDCITLILTLMHTPQARCASSMKRKYLP
jgi:hypothetical protein